MCAVKTSHFTDIYRCVLQKIDEQMEWKPKLLTAADLEKAKERLEKGESKRAIAKSLNIAESTLRKRLKKVNLRYIFL